MEADFRSDATDARLLRRQRRSVPENWPTETSDGLLPSDQLPTATNARLLRGPSRAVPES